jgi:hypothetical protein
VAVLLPSDPVPDRLPEPIPASYYARPPEPARTAPALPGLPGSGPAPSPVRGRVMLAGLLGLLLATGVLALIGPRPASPAGQATARSAAASRPGPAPTPTPAAPPAAVPTATAAPAPTPTPSPSPTASPSPSPSALGVTFLNAPLAARRGQTVTLRVQTAPGARCATTVGYPDAPALDPTRSDGAGNVSWTWHVSSRAQRGSWPIQTTCGRAASSSLLLVS